MTDHTVPPIGMRMIKTAAAVLICLLVSMAVDREDMRIYSSIAALLCVQPYAEDTKRMAIQRIVGTAIGSVFGIATLLLEMALDIQGTLVGYIVIAAVTVPNLWIAVVLKSPKTRTSARRLGITGLQDLQQVLRRAWERRRSDDPKEWVVLRQDGAPPKPDQLTRDLLTVVRRQGLPKISLHGLRHSFASVANSQGVPMFDISRTLGHSSMTVTSNIYTHLFDDTEAQALAAVARAIEKA